MRAAFKAARERFDIREVDTPTPGTGECLVRVHYCATCAWCYKEWLRDGTDDIHGAGATGHEMSGVVAEVGADVDRWKPGDRVLTYFTGHCEKCPECAAGATTRCSGPDRPDNVYHGYADYVLASQQCLLPAPEGIDLKHGTLISDMVGTSMHAIRRAFLVPIPTDAVAVWGIGPVGVFVVQGLRSCSSVGRIIALDPIASRRELALELGADEALDPAADTVAERLRRENSGRGPTYAFNSALQSAEMPYSTLAADGCLMNITGGVLTESQCEKRVDGSFYFYKGEYEDNVRLVREGRIRLEPAITHEFPVDQINEAMEVRAKQQPQSQKVVIRCI